jgi:hypothetical protein
MPGAIPVHINVYIPAKIEIEQSSPEREVFVAIINSLVSWTVTMLCVVFLLTIFFKNSKVF